MSWIQATGCVRFLKRTEIADSLISFCWISPCLNCNKTIKYVIRAPMMDVIRLRFRWKNPPAEKPSKPSKRIRVRRTFFYIQIKLNLYFNNFTKVKKTLLPGPKVGSLLAFQLQHHAIISKYGSFFYEFALMIEI